MTVARRAIPQQPAPDTVQIRALPTADNGEALVPASLAPDRILARPRYHLEGLPGALPECFVRESVLQRLLNAADALPVGYRLVIFDGWRPVSLQRWLFDRCTHEFGQTPDSAAGDDIESFVSRPMPDPQTNPPYHHTGGAVDLSIADAGGRLLDMGTGFDAMVDASRTHYFESMPGHDAATIAIRDNRRLLYHAMIDAGFVNLPSEWWHFDYGDQLWAAVNGELHAVYGAIAPDFRWGDLP